ncbi:putative holin-like toxin [Tumebacillus lipolyticus]|uniref:Holin-like toxin n=1 Tax=Tumebacillus lipolyticus TaxID=1280370 RepID=A0ABW4ZX05_9BACL
MSTKDVISLMLQFGLFLLAALTLVVTIVKHLVDNQNKKIDRP